MPSFRYALFLLALTPAVTGCQYYASHEARRAQDELVGLSQDELHLCAGLPTKSEARGAATYDTYEQSFSGSSGFSASLPLVGGINFAGDGYCHATFKLVDGKVMEVDYAGDTGDILGHVSNCAALVNHCLDQEARAKATRPGKQPGGNRRMPLFTGTAGWAIPKEQAAAFPAGGSHLERYATTLPAAEINSSFYKQPRAGTYDRWAASVPRGFRFAVKMPKEITHTRRLREAAVPLGQFLASIRPLGEALGPILIQLPPSLPYEGTIARDFLQRLRAGFTGQAVCEPRHASWFADEADTMLKDFEVARVAADPAPVPAASLPGGWPSLIYRRLHGSPRMYYSAYSDDYLADLARIMQRETATESWCIFDNTASGAAMANALRLLSLDREAGTATA